MCIDDVAVDVAVAEVNALPCLPRLAPALLDVVAAVL